MLSLDFAAHKTSNQAMERTAICCTLHFEMIPTVTPNDARLRPTSLIFVSLGRRS